MFARVSLLWKRPDVSAQQLRTLWLGEHADQARRLAGIREYVIDFTEEPVDGQPDGVATLRFDSREACLAAFADQELVAELTRTRADFAERVQVFFVDEVVVHREPGPPDLAPTPESTA